MEKMMTSQCHDAGTNWYSMWNNWHEASSEEQLTFLLIPKDHYWRILSSETACTRCKLGLHWVQGIVSETVETSEIHTWTACKARKNGIHKVGSVTYIGLTWLKYDEWCYTSMELIWVCLQLQWHDGCGLTQHSWWMVHDSLIHRPHPLSRKAWGH